MFTGPEGRHKAITLAITCIGVFMVLLDISIVSVALPAIQAGLHAGLSGLQWVVDAYTLPFAVLLLSAGSLGDRFGRKRLFLVGLAGFVFGSALCGFAPNLTWLVMGRAIQGAGGAALSPGSLSLLSSAFSDPKERIQALGLWAGISGIAIAAGSVVGGILVEAAGWPAIFLVNVPVGFVAFGLGSRALRESSDPFARRADIAGQALAIGGLFALTYALIQGNAFGWTSPAIVGLFALAVVLLAGFLVVEARSAEPMLPLSLFKAAMFSAANASGLIVGFSLLGTVFFLAQYFQAIQGYDALGSGLRALPLTLGAFIGAPVAGRVAARYGFRPPILAGAASAATGLLLLTNIGPTTAYVDLWWKLALVGLGFGVMVSPLTAAVMISAPPSRAGLASSVVNFSRQVGSVFGVALLGALVQQSFATHLAARLIAAGVPASQSAALAVRLSALGSAADRAPAAGTSLTAAQLQALVASAFTDALHVAYALAGAGVLIIVALALTVFGRRQAQAAAPVVPLAEAA